MQIDENKPCLIQTGQGFSVEYKGRFLYSKYSPKKSILNAIENLEILPDTLFFCTSPLLCYGLKELEEKLEKNCFILALEEDENLFSLTEEYVFKTNILKDSFKLISKDESKNLVSDFYKNFKGEFKRIVKIEFSAGTKLNESFYNETFFALQNIINQFWKNRLTLIKFGRLFSGNLFKNLKVLSESKDFFSVEKPVLIVGSGESALKTLISLKNRINEFFVISVDASLKAISSLGLKIDAAICEESQFIIEKSFIGQKNVYKSLFLSLTANHNVAKLNPEKNVFYTSLYSNENFLGNLVKRKIICHPIEPLGSVGLSAVQIALKIRKNEEVPIFVTGLDFSFSKGKTHLKSSFHENERRKISTKLKNIDNFESSFSSQSIKTTGKNGETVFTNQALKSYRDLFVDRFSKTKNIYDLGETGLDLEILRVSENDVLKNESITIPKHVNKEKPSFILETFPSLKHEISRFFEEEKNALLELKGILTGKTELSEKNRNERILEILKAREYLYLHFADGYKPNLSQGFLKRVRSELEYFLKIFSEF